MVEPIEEKNKQPIEEKNEEKTEVLVSEIHSSKFANAQKIKRIDSLATKNIKIKKISVMKKSL